MKTFVLKQDWRPLSPTMPGKAHYSYINSKENSREHMSQLPTQQFDIKSKEFSTMVPIQKILWTTPNQVILLMAKTFYG